MKKKIFGKYKKLGLVAFFLSCAVMIAGAVLIPYFNKAEWNVEVPYQGVTVNDQGWDEPFVFNITLEPGCSSCEYFVIERHGCNGLWLEWDIIVSDVEGVDVTQHAPASLCSVDSPLFDTPFYLSEGGTEYMCICIELDNMIAPGNYTVSAQLNEVVV